MNRTDDECYTGTGPAAEVVGQVPERDALAEQLACVRQALPLPLRDCAVPSVGVATLEAERAELLAQRDELAKAARFTADVLSEIYAKHSLKIGPFSTQAQKANVMLGAALSRIKGA